MNRTKWLVAGGAALVVLLGLGIGLLLTKQVTNEDDIREAVFRYQFEHDAFDLTTPPERRATRSVLYIAIEGKNPSVEFLERFKGNVPPVKPASAGARNSDGPEGSPIIYDQKGIRWVGRNSVEVEAHERFGSSEAAGYLCRLVRKDGKWIVKEILHNWMT